MSHHTSRSYDGGMAKLIRESAAYGPYGHAVLAQRDRLNVALAKQAALGTPVLAGDGGRAFVPRRRRKTAELERLQCAPMTASAVPAAPPRNAPAGIAGHAMSLMSRFFMRASHGFPGSAR